MLKPNCYLDDGIGASDSLNIELETQKELITILKCHGFNLKKWCAYHPLLLKNIPTIRIIMALYDRSFLDQGKKKSCTDYLKT